MQNRCNIIINGRRVVGKIGETLIDAGLSGWVVIPHDCCSGQCETCRVEIVSGTVDDQGTRDGRTVLACQATVQGDAAIRFDEVLIVRKSSGVLSSIIPLSSKIVEACVRLPSALEIKPGQYLGVKFAGYPSRDLSPTQRADGSCAKNELIFHIHRYPGGLMSSQLGSTIRAGHRVHLRGPFGHAFLREGSGPIILVAGGTGWAPIWSLACAARREQQQRELIVIAGARDPDGLYMRRSLDWLRDNGSSNVIATVETGASDWMLRGRPTHYLPSLGLEDTVYVAGPPGLVDTVRHKARIANARCYADPFLPGTHKASVLDRIVRMLNARGPQVGHRNQNSVARQSIVPFGTWPPK